MKKYFSIGILIIYCFSMVQIGQWMKIPFLIEHFYHHQSKHQGGSFSSFLYHHYVVEDENDQDEEEDRKLPFKSIATDFFKMTACPWTEAFMYRYVVIEDFGDRLNTFYEEFIISTFLASVWHPPK
ncbi:MAG: hypothetical protein JNJ58_14005 [Chitinophagaceae bacterium]|nr:hypothetical protein [Chitinophagaceae bacterium]